MAKKKEEEIVEEGTEEIAEPVDTGWPPPKPTEEVIN